jgi:predicted RNase H-like nuclease (RuvC/YqgF family)
MSDLEKTIKIRAFSSNAMNDLSQNKPAEEDQSSLTFTKPTAPAEGEPSKFIEFAKVIEQLGKSLKEEQSKSAELTKKLGTLEEEQAKSAKLAQRVSELEEEQRKSLESAKKLAETEAQIKELSEALGKIANIAAATAKKPG